jgi:cation transporter-like permease
MLAMLSVTSIGVEKVDFDPDHIAKPITRAFSGALGQR